METPRGNSLGGFHRNQCQRGSCLSRWSSVCYQRAFYMIHENTWCAYVHMDRGSEGTLPCRDERQQQIWTTGTSEAVAQHSWCTCDWFMRVCGNPFVISRCCCCGGVSQSDRSSEWPRSLIPSCDTNSWPRQKIQSDPFQVRYHLELISLNGWSLDSLLL